MSQTGYTPILTYASGTATNVPLAANLTSNASGAELALNYADGKLFYKDSGGVVQVLASKAGNINVASFQTSLGGLTPSTATTGVVTLSGTLNTTSGGTGLTSFTAGDLPYYAAGTLLSKLAIGTSGQFLTSSGTAPQWSTLSGVAVTTFSAGTTGFTPSTATSGAITLSGTLATTNGGTGLTSFTANGVVYASSTSALATGSALTFDGSTLVSSSGVRANSFMEIRNNSATLYWENAANTLYWAQKLTGSDFAWDYYNGSGVTEQMRLTSSLLTVVPGATIQGITVGRGAGAVSTNTAVGASALAANTSGATNTAIGERSLFSTTTGSTNTAVGYRTLYTNVSGTENTAQGYAALYYNTGNGNSAFGTQALFFNSTASNNTAVGFQSAYLNTTGNRLVAVGTYALFDNSTGASNVAVGMSSLENSTTGSNNTAIGDSALFSNTTASNNTAVGYQAGYTNTTSVNNTYFGFQAGYLSTSASNTFIGLQSGYAATGGTNTFIGFGAGGVMTTGAKNTIIGAYGGNQGGLDIRTASNYIVLSDGDGNPRGFFDGSGNFLVGGTSLVGGNEKFSVQQTGNARAAVLRNDAGANWDTLLVWNAATTGDNLFQQFSTEAAVTIRGTISYNRGAGLTAYNTTSDYRAKDIIGPVVDSGALIDSVPVYMGKMKGATQERPMFIAHEVPAYAHTGVKDAVDADGNPVYQQMDASALVPVMWAEIQNLRKRLAAAGI